MPVRYGQSSPCGGVRASWGPKGRPFTIRARRAAEVPGLAAVALGPALLPGLGADPSAGKPMPHPPPWRVPIAAEPAASTAGIAARRSGGSGPDWRLRLALLAVRSGSTV